MAEDLTGKWAYSHDEEQYYGPCDTKEEAIAECCHNGGSGRVGQYAKPPNPWDCIAAWSLINDILCQKEFDHDAADDFMRVTTEQQDELSDMLRPAFQQWCEKHGFIPDWWNIERCSIERVDPEEPANG